MRVVFNRMATWKTKTGVGHYADQLLRALRRHAIGVQIDSYPNSWMWMAYHVWEWLGKPNRGLIDSRQFEKRAEPSAASPPPPNVPRRWSLGWGPRLRAWHRQTTFFGEGYDLYHEPNFIPEPSDCPTLATIHDLSGLLHPEWHPADRNGWYQEHFHRALDQCTHFLADTEFTRQEMLQHLHIAPHRVTRVHLGCRPECRPLAADAVARGLRRLGLPPTFLLFVGTVEPRKNVLRLLQAYGDLPAAVRDRWPLLLAGPWGWNAGPIAAFYESQARQAGVRHLGYVSDADLVVLYNAARALVLPSHYEGFGLPVLEMMACGGAVVASTAPALVEIAGGHAHHVAPEDVDGLRAALHRVATDDDWRRSLRAGTIERARSFTWDRTALDTLQVYRQMCGSAAPTALAA